jgi:transposase
VKILRSVKCALRFATQAKRKTLKDVMTEYARVVNLFIDHFWATAVPTKAQLLKPIVDLPETWFTARLRKVAAREAIDMIRAARQRDGEKARKPVHRGRRMCLSGDTGALKKPKTAGEFDAWLHLASIGKGILLDLPIRFHRRWHHWASRGRRLNSYLVTREYIQFSFEVETGAKPAQPEAAVGIDTGMMVLAARSDGARFGQDVRESVERIRRSKHGSQGQKRARRALRQIMDESARDAIQGCDLVVVEALRNLNHKTRLTRRVSKNMRRLLGAWAFRYWLRRLRMTCDANRVRFASVSAWNTSRECHACGHAEQRNRLDRDHFRCLKCGCAGDADLNAARVILKRYLTGPYGAGCKPKTTG